MVGIDCYCGGEGLRRLLSRTDILVALLPLTNQTRGLLNASPFAQSKRGGRLGGPVLVDAGRGGLQVEADILAALDSGILKGASLDVFEREPLPVDSALWLQIGFRAESVHRSLDAVQSRRSLGRPEGRGSSPPPSNREAPDRL